MNAVQSFGMSVDAYLVVHLLGIFMIVTALTAAIGFSMSAGSRDFPQRRTVGLVHGLGLLIALIAGFAMLGKMHLGFPGWALGKFLIWLGMGAAPAIIYRKPSKAMAAWFAIIAFAVVAAYLARFKPF